MLDSARVQRSLPRESGGLSTFLLRHPERTGQAPMGKEQAQAEPEGHTPLAFCPQPETNPQTKQTSWPLKSTCLLSLKRKFSPYGSTASIKPQVPRTFTALEHPAKTCQLLNPSPAAKVPPGGPHSIQDMRS